MTNPSESPCTAEEARQFDFWLGEWDVTWGEGARGCNRIEAVLDGCVIVENFDGQPGTPLRGMSMSIYDRRLGQWRQTWMDNQGSCWTFTGGMQDGRMVLSTDDVRDGQPVKLRMVWFNLAADSLDWHWERSDDGGQTWRVLWALHYTRRRS